VTIPFLFLSPHILPLFQTSLYTTSLPPLYALFDPSLDALETCKVYPTPFHFHFKTSRQSIKKTTKDFNSLLHSYDSFRSRRFIHDRITIRRRVTHFTKDNQNWIKGGGGFSINF